jgi:hypothetical protein
LKGSSGAIVGPSPAAVEYANAGLMAASCAAACAMPFQVFLLAYVVLGPLHYLTEIAWLRERRYFTSVRGDAFWLGAFAVLASLAAFVPAARPYSAWTLSVGVFSAVGVAILRAPGGALALAGYMGAVLLLSAGRPFEALVAAALIPTFVHVFAFTGLFILAGALKDRRPSAALGLAVFAACAVVCVLAPAGAAAVGPRTASAFKAGGFEFVHHALYGLLFRARLDPERLFADPRSAAIARLTAFAYTYHYLNWFSKTTIIRWHEVGARSIALSVAGWAAAVGLYAWNYAFGIAALSVLSMLHVMLELPLDAVTAANVARGLLARGARGPASC